MSKKTRGVRCRLEAPLHLRLLSTLCADVANGTALRAEFAARIDEVTAMQTQHRQLLIDVRGLLPAHACAQHGGLTFWVTLSIGLQRQAFICEVLGLRTLLLLANVQEKI